MQQAYLGWCPRISQGLFRYCIRSISVCIRAALQSESRHYEFLCQSQAVDPDGYEEAKYMYELELARPSEIHAVEEKLGRTSISLAALIKASAPEKP